MEKGTTNLKNSHDESMKDKAKKSQLSAKQYCTDSKQKAKKKK